MITHEIQVVIPVSTAVQRPNREWPWVGGRSKVQDRMNKIEYAQFVSKLPYKVGSIVVSNYMCWDTTPTKQMSPDRMYIVSDIHELHQLVDYNSDGHPRCLFLKNLHLPQRTNGFWSSPDTWMILKYEEISDEAKAYVDARNNDSTTN